MLSFSVTASGDNTKPKFTGLVGKGVCFDAGGLNLKPTGSIEDMQLDMAAPRRCWARWRPWRE